FNITANNISRSTKGDINKSKIKMLDENHHLIQCIMDYQSKGKTSECTQYVFLLYVRDLLKCHTFA
uniref:SS18 N-terminal domain-containing protein n=1 Tax=Cyprinus carpio TaxID=7962 RepID=A0A8C2DAF2_CYPCA